MQREVSEIELYEGWQPTVKIVLHEIRKLGAQVLQVKEKFGDLRIYYHTNENNVKIASIIKDAEVWCSEHCEYCGKPGKRRNLKGWFKTCCMECSEKHIANTL